MTLEKLKWKVLYVSLLCKCHNKHRRRERERERERERDGEIRKTKREGNKDN